MEIKRSSFNVPISFGHQNNTQSIKDTKISQLDVSELSKNNSSIYSSSEYQYTSSIDGIKDEYYNHSKYKMDYMNDNPKTVKFVSGLKEESVELKLSSLYCVGIE